MRVKMQRAGPMRVKMQRAGPMRVKMQRAGKRIDNPQRGLLFRTVNQHYRATCEWGAALPA